MEAANAITSFLLGSDPQAFSSDELVRSAVLQKLTIIGEAAARLSPDVKGRHGHVPWSDIIAFRNQAVHAYFAIDWEIVWVTATSDVPDLQRQIEAILAAEFSDDL